MNTQLEGAKNLMSLFNRKNRQSDSKNNNSFFALDTGRAMEFAVAFEIKNELDFREEEGSDGLDSLEGDRMSDALNRICSFLNRTCGIDISFAVPSVKYLASPDAIDAFLDNISASDSDRIKPIITEIMETTAYLKESADSGLVSHMSSHSKSDGKYRASADLAANNFNSLFGWNWTADVKTKQEEFDSEFSWIVGLFLMKVLDIDRSPKFFTYASIFVSSLACEWERSPERNT